MPCCYEHPSHSLSKDHLSGAVEPRRGSLQSAPPASQSVALYGHRAGPWVHHQETPFLLSSRPTIASRPYLLPRIALQSPGERGSAREVAVWMLQTKKRPATRLSGFPFQTKFALVAAAAALLIAGNHAVFNVNDTMCVLGNIVLVRDQDDRVPLGLQAVKQCHDFDTSLRVEVPSRFVSQDDRRLVHQRPR